MMSNRGTARLTKIRSRKSDSYHLILHNRAPASDFHLVSEKWKNIDLGRSIAFIRSNA